MLGQLSPLSLQASAVPKVQSPVISAPGSGAGISTPTFIVSGKSEKGAEIIMRVGAGGELLSLGLVIAEDGSFNFPATIGIEGSLSIYFTAKLGAFESAAKIVPVAVNFRPEMPQELAAEGKDTWVLVKWSRVNAEDVVRYAIFRDGNLQPMVSVAQCPAGQVPQHRDLALTNGRTYSYRVQAVDSAGNTSDMSVSVSAVPVAGPEWAP